MPAAQFSMQPGGADLFAQLIEKQPPTTVDSNGGLFYCWQTPGISSAKLWLVGTIGFEANHPPTDAWFGNPLGVTPPTPLFTPSETEHETTTDEQQQPTTVSLPLSQTALTHTESDTNSPRARTPLDYFFHTLFRTVKNYLPVFPLSVTADDVDLRSFDRTAETRQMIAEEGFLGPLNWDRTYRPPRTPRRPSVHLTTRINIPLSVSPVDIPCTNLTFSIGSGRTSSTR